MSELTLKEAVEHLEDELNNQNHNWECTECKQENEQVLKWLKTLKTITEKGLPLVEKDMIKQSENYEQYRIKFSWWISKPFTIEKTEEEFELLKEVLDK